MPRLPDSPSRTGSPRATDPAQREPIVGSGEPPDRARARQDDRRAELAAALIRPDAREPRATLYTDHWKEARAHAARMHRTRPAGLWVRLLAHQELGWRYVRPLALAVEEARRGPAGPDPADALYRFAEVEVVDLYRYNAFRCAGMVLAPHGPDGIPSADDVEAETDAFYRCVCLLRMASAHPLAPPEFPVLAEHAAGLDDWYADFRRVFAPAAKAFHRRLRKLGYWGG